MREIFAAHCNTLSLANFPQRDLNKTCQNLFCFHTLPPLTTFIYMYTLCIMLPAIISQPGHSSGKKEETNSNYAFHHQMLSFYCSCDLKKKKKRLFRRADARGAFCDTTGCYNTTTDHLRGITKVPAISFIFHKNCCISHNDNDPETLNQHITAEKLFRISLRSFVFQDGTFVFIRLRTIIKLKEINFPHITLCRKLCIGC